MATSVVKDFQASVKSQETDANKKPAPFILVVGEASHWRTAGKNLPVDNQLIFVDFEEVTGELLETLSPNIVLSPLLCASFDCLDLAQVLQRLGYNGRYRVLTQNVPDPMLVKCEIRSISPSIDFDLITTPAHYPYGSRLN